MMAPPIWSSTMAIVRKSSPTRTARSCCQAANPLDKEGACSHETGPTGLCAFCLRPFAYRVHDRRTAYRATGLQCLAWLLRKGGTSMQPTPDESLSTTNEPCQPSTGQGASKARLIPTALMGPAQQGWEPLLIILTRIAIGVSVAPNVPALPAALTGAAEYRPTLVLTPVTNEGKGEDTGAHEPHPEEEDAAQVPA